MLDIKIERNASLVTAYTMVFEQFRNFIFSIFINYKFLPKVMNKQISISNPIQHRLHFDSKFEKYPA